MSYWYVATPYTKFPAGIDAAFELACRAAAALVRGSVPAYSPIVHCHPVALYGGIDPLDHSLWMAADEPMMRGAHGLLIIKAETWDQSRGIAEEIKAFERMKKPTVYCEARTLESAVFLAMLRHHAEDGPATDAVEAVLPGEWE